MKLRDRLSAAWRAFQGDRWNDPKCLAQIDAEMAVGAMQSIHQLLDSGGIPRGTFADDHVRNLVALYNQRGARIAELEMAIAVRAMQ